MSKVESLIKRLEDGDQYIDAVDDAIVMLRKTDHAISQVCNSPMGELYRILTSLLVHDYLAEWHIKPSHTTVLINNEKPTLYSLRDAGLIFELPELHCRWKLTEEGQVLAQWLQNGS